LTSTAAGKHALERPLALARPLVFITGKGGCGKTTISATLATRFSRLGKRVLIATSDPQERISQLLGVAPLSEQIRQVAENIWAININATAALREYGELVLKVGVLSHAVFDNRRVQQFFSAVPGLHQWAILGKSWYHSTERQADGTPRFDHVIFDGPATGHALQMLWVPKIVTDVAHAGVLLRDAERAWTMLHDPMHTALVVVSHADESSATETLELVTKLRQELNLVPAAGVINALVSPLLAESERQALNALDLSLVADRFQSQVQALAHRAALEHASQINLARLREAAHFPWFALPRLAPDADSPAAIERLSELLATHDPTIDVGR